MNGHGGEDGMEPTTDAAEAVQPGARRIILDSRWWSNATGHVGVVAARTGMHDADAGEWKAYIGVGTGRNVEAYERLIAGWGDGLRAEEAKALFPHLDITKYKKDED